MQYDVTAIPQCRNLIQFFIIVNGKNILHFKGTYMQNVHWNIIGFLGFGWNFVHLTHPPGSVMMASAFTLTNSNVITSPSVLKKKKSDFILLENARPKQQVIFYEMRRHSLYWMLLSIKTKKTGFTSIYQWHPKSAQLLIFWFLKSRYKKPFSRVRSNTFKNIPQGNHTHVHNCGPSYLFISLACFCGGFSTCLYIWFGYIPLWYLILIYLLIGALVLTPVFFCGLMTKSMLCWITQKLVMTTLTRSKYVSHML